MEGDDCALALIRSRIEGICSHASVRQDEDTSYLLAIGRFGVHSIDLRRRDGALQIEYWRGLPEDEDLTGEWRVSGRRVEVDGKTKIRREDGVEPAIGRVVEVNGRVDEDGVVSARMIVVKGTMLGGLAQHFGAIESLPARVT